jgi:hypothetical protein
MTRTDVMASSRPQQASATRLKKGSLMTKRTILALPVVFALMIAFVVPGTALAAEGELNGYTTTTTTTTTTTPPTTPTTPPTTPTTPTTAPTATTPAPATGTLPEKQSSTPTKTTAPEKTSTTPTSSTEPTAKKASTLPFTGFDLRWTVGAGVLLLAMGFSIVATQRRQRRNTGR